MLPAFHATRSRIEAALGSPLLCERFIDANNKVFRLLFQLRQSFDQFQG